MAEKKSSHYLSGKEVRAIAKENRKIMNALEKRKHRRADESEFTTEMKDPANILEIEDLHTYFFTDQGVVKAVNGVSFNVPKNATVGVVGESGCGKSVTSMSVMQLLQGPQGQIVSGAIRFNSHDFKRDSHGNLIPTGEVDHNGTPLFEMEDKVFDIASMPIHEIHRIRGRQIAMIFQEPMTSL
ncbi:MAG: ATP-binding cassette domain-containing protein, partial [Clostridia bacterium]|nr:ATP-binding cassette domain-containing protein [Clostridia bacterium]